MIVGVGVDVPREDYPALTPLLEALDAQLGATRPVVDRGWLPHARQIGLTGRAVAPRLYVAVGLAGRPAHLVGVSGAETVLAVHDRPDAPVFDGADVGIRGDWRDVVPRLAVALGARADRRRGLLGGNGRGAPERGEERRGAADPERSR